MMTQMTQPEELERAPQACILCNGRRRSLLYEKNGWQVRVCDACGLGVLDPRPSADTLARLYSQEYCEEYFVEGGEPGSAAFAKRLRLEDHRIRFFRKYKKAGRVLDIGCGYGYFLAACREKGYEVHGLDFSEWAVRHARQRLGLDITVGPMDRVGLADGSFDVVTLWHCLEHTPDPVMALSRIRQWLKPDGLLVVDVPNRQGTDARKTWDDWVGWSLPYHLYHFTPESLEGLLDQQGFSVIRSKNYHSESVKAALRPIPVVGFFARLVAKIYSGHSFAVVAKMKPALKAVRP
jgi:SAM-dependent methyltransferase